MDIEILKHLQFTVVVFWVALYSAILKRKSYLHMKKFRRKADEKKLYPLQEIYANPVNLGGFVC